MTETLSKVRRRLPAEAKTIRAAAAWSIIGTALGSIVAHHVPLIASAIGASTGTGAVFGALYVLGILGTRRRSPLVDVRADLRAVDEMFLDGRIDTQEFRALRAKILEKFAK